jgi:hypothetical protein
VALTANPAIALRTILENVTHSGASTVLEGWEATLHTKGNTRQFAQRHGEVVALCNRVYDRLLALPPECDGRDQYMQYVPLWYQAIVFRHHWGNSGQPASSIADAQVVSQLTGLGAAFELYSMTTKAPPEEAIASLRDSLDQWDSILSDLDLSDKLANELRSHVDRLRLLLEEEIITTFGTEPVVNASRNLFGAAIDSMSRVPPKVAKRIAVGLVTVAAFLHTAHNAADDANGLLEGVVTFWSHVTELTSGPMEIGSRTTPQLGAGQTGKPDGTNDGDPIDAEIVEESPSNEPDGPSRALEG